MNTYKIATSSTADLTRDYLDAHRIPLISYTYMVNGQVMVDDCKEDSRQKVYEGMRAGDLLKTSMITTDQYEVFFRSQMKDGGDLIFLDMSALSISRRTRVRMDFSALFRPRAFSTTSSVPRSGT